MTVDLHVERFRHRVKELDHIILIDLLPDDPNNFCWASIHRDHAADSVKNLRALADKIEACLDNPEPVYTDATT